MDDGIDILINIQDDLIRLQAAGALESLLRDRTTRKNILWATDAYAESGPQYGRNEEITPDLITGDQIGIIKTRARKAFEQQNTRTRQRAEVFTPLWVCEKMCDHLDEAWFGRKAGFHKTDRETGHVVFTTGRTWRQYIQSRRLEITCGEGPFLVSRYDASTGRVVPLSERVGMLDRKMRAIDENAADEAEWLQWAAKAFRSIYGFEFQGDSLLIARVNLMMTFVEYLSRRWHRLPSAEEYRTFSEIITWNLWQMDGLTGAIPYAGPGDGQLSLFDLDPKPPPLCRVYNWRQQSSTEYRNINRGTSRMKFDFIIGNPPYQDETLGDNKGFAPPIYHMFLDGAYEKGTVVELIHPARFLFNAGSTPKQWNQKMLDDPHLKVLHYEQDASTMFHNTEIKGGVVITYHDTNKSFGAIEVFSPYPEMNTIMHKAAPKSEEESLMSIIYVQNRFNLDALYQEYPEYEQIIGSNGKDKRFRNNIFDKIPLFTDDSQNSDDIAVIGVVKNKRQWRYFPIRFTDTNHENLYKWKLLVVRVNGTGAIGEVLSTPIIAKPNEGYTQTFIGIGAFDGKAEAENALKYVKSKFMRTMLGILKITQDNNRETWRMVPLQDFTPSSDIDWTKPIPEIDRQLYAKYGLDQTEIDFIESHVKEMT